MLTRRDFLARLQAAGLTFPLAGQLNLLDYRDVSKSQVFQNDYFSVSFDLKTGRTDINRRNGAKLLTGSVVRALTGQGYISSGQSSYRHSVRSGKISDQLGEGQQVTINSSNPDNSIDFNLTLSLYKNHHAVFIEAACFNRSIYGQCIQHFSAQAVLYHHPKRTMGCGSHGRSQSPSIFSSGSAAHQ